MRLAPISIVPFLLASCFGGHRADVRPLRVIPTHAPRFVVGFYDAGGTYPQVRDGGRDMRAVNAAVRAVISRDQRRYVAGMGDTRSGHLGLSCGGIYETSIDPRLISASTVLVSALLPAFELNPCGTEGSGWVAMTVLVPSGRRVNLTDLFANRARALRVLARAWKRRFRRTQYGTRLLEIYREEFRAAAFEHAFFALTRYGLAVGFWQIGPTVRLHAVVPYSVLFPYFSPLGARLAENVRSPKYDGRSPRVKFSLGDASTTKSLFRTAARHPVRCALVDRLRHRRRIVSCSVATPHAARVTMTPSGRLLICRGNGCAGTPRRSLLTLGYGEWIQSNSFFCVSPATSVRCIANLPDRVRGFVIGRGGVKRLK